MLLCSYNSILCKIPQKHLSAKETLELGAIKLLSGLLRRVYKTLVL
jgi:hypothetical protein